MQRARMRRVGLLVICVLGIVATLFLTHFSHRGATIQNLVAGTWSGAKRTITYHSNGRFVLRNWPSGGGGGGGGSWHVESGNTLVVTWDSSLPLHRRLFDDSNTERIRIVSVSPTKLKLQAPYGVTTFTRVHEGK